MVYIWSTKIQNFLQKDKQHGLRTIWYEHGQKQLTAQFVDDKMEGNAKVGFPISATVITLEIIWSTGLAMEWDKDGKKNKPIR